MSITRYPLSWPASRLRTPTAARKGGRFFAFVKGRDPKHKQRRDVTIAEAVQRVLDELSRYNGAGQGERCNPLSVVISTNVETRRDGLPAGNAREPVDAGAAVYFNLDRMPYCLPCDRYERLADNLAAIAAHIEATRAIERHGVATAHDAYAGFKALPSAGSPPATAAGSYWQTLGIIQTKDVERINRAYRELAVTRHPDKPGGSHDQMQQLNQARDHALTYAAE